MTKLNNNYIYYNFIELIIKINDRIKILKSHNKKINDFLYYNYFLKKKVI